VLGGGCEVGWSTSAIEALLVLETKEEADVSFVRESARVGLSQRSEFRLSTVGCVSVCLRNSIIGYHWNCRGGAPAWSHQVIIEAQH